MLAQQLYLSRFIDYRFRPAAQITDQQVEDYYSDEFVPQLKSAAKSGPAAGRRGRHHPRNADSAGDQQRAAKSG